MAEENCTRCVRNEPALRAGNIPVRHAFTLAELVTTVSVLALAGTILSPALSRSAKRSSEAVCLSNLRTIASASHMYAAEDARQQLSPLHSARVTRLHSRGFVPNWGWRTAAARTFGGVAPVQPMIADGGVVIEVMMDQHWGGDPASNPWGTATRPLNAYVPDPTTAFHCPADTGYPAVGDWSTDPMDYDAPMQSAGIPCFEYLGNSYRDNSTGIVWLAGSILMRGIVSSGSVGHAAWAVPVPNETVLYSEAVFNWAARTPPNYPEIPDLSGWHGSGAADNIAYVDGSARLTAVGQQHQWDPAELQAMGFSPDFINEPYYFLHRGAGWRMDCYPAPGALVKVYNDQAPYTCLFDPSLLAGFSGWPFDHYTENDTPYPGR
jgi:type II secretory pathway pseudopilin PulG